MKTGKGHTKREKQEKSMPRRQEKEPENKKKAYQKRRD